MQLKNFGIFTSLCSVAAAPYALFKFSSKPEDSQIISDPIRLAGGGIDESELNGLDNFFSTYCRKVYETVIVCKNRELFHWPEFYFVDKEEESGKPQKIQSLIFQMVDKNPVLELVLEKGKRKRVDDFSGKWNTELFEKIPIVPDSDCILLDKTGKAGNKPHSISCKISKDYGGGQWVNLPI